MSAALAWLKRTYQASGLLERSNGSTGELSLLHSTVESRYKTPIDIRNSTPAPPDFVWENKKPLI